MWHEIIEKLRALEQRVQQTESTARPTAAEGNQLQAVRVIAEVNADVGKAVRGLAGAWFYADDTQAERAPVGVVSRIIQSAGGNQREVVLWGLRYAPGTIGTVWYLGPAASPGVLTSTPPAIGGTDFPDQPTQVFTHIVEVQVTESLRFVRPDIWKSRIQAVSTCEVAEEDAPPAPAERNYLEVTES